MTQVIKADVWIVRVYIIEPFARVAALNAVAVFEQLSEA